MHFAKTLVLGTLLGAVAPNLLAQSNPASGTNPQAASPAPAKAGQQPAKPAAPSPAPAKPADKTPAKASTPTPAPTAALKPAPQAAKPAAQAPAKPVTKAPAQQAAKAPAKPAAKKATKKVVKASAPATGTKPPAESEMKVARRDPFESLIGRDKAGTDAGKNLPPGKAGLQVSTLRLDGVVKAPNGMIAVVSNPQSRTYFLREGDQLYDGQVEKIAMDGVSFHEMGKDAFGKPVERQVNKRIYSSPGEQQ
jgi:Tfp pilus assembly protein PilP